VQSQCPSPSSSLNKGLDKGKSFKKDDKRPSSGSTNSTNTVVATEEDGVWSAVNLADLYDHNISPTDSIESFFDISWDHIPGYLSG
jgi:hypothetical protein